MGNTVGSHISVGTAKPLTGDLPWCPEWAVEVGCPSPGLVGDLRGWRLSVSLPILPRQGKTRANLCLGAARMQLEDQEAKQVV